MFRFEPFSIDDKSFTDDHCCVCHKAIREGIHDLQDNMIYCLDHADENGPKQCVYVAGSDADDEGGE